jgi:hypothetical protein
MPYIAKEERHPYQKPIHDIVKDIADLDYKEKGSALRVAIVALIRNVYFGAEWGSVVDLSSLIPNDHTKRSGHMNYTISRIISKSYGDKALRYYEWNQIIGTLELVKSTIEDLRDTGSYTFIKNYVWIEIFGFLEGAKMEIYRRYVAPYEDSKITDPSCGDLLEV